MESDSEKYSQANEDKKKSQGDLWDFLFSAWKI